VRVGSSSFPLFHPFVVFPKTVLGPVFFSMYISPLAHIASQFNVCQQKFADDTQLMLFISPSNNKSSLTYLLTYYSIVYHLPEAGFFLQWPCSQLRHDWSYLHWNHPPNTISAVSHPFNWLTPLSYLATTSQISYFHIWALCHIRTFLDLENSKSIACAIVSSRLDYANTCLSGFSCRVVNFVSRWNRTARDRYS